MTRYIDSDTGMWAETIYVKETDGSFTEYTVDDYFEEFGYFPPESV